MTLHRVVIILLLLGSTCLQAEEIPAEKLQAIQELIRVTNAEVNSAAFVDAFSQQIWSVLKANNPDIPDSALMFVREEVGDLVAEEMQKESLLSLIYPIYASHFTLEELQGLIAFNRSAVGQKANRVMPTLMQQSRAAAQSWSQSVGPRISQRVANRFGEEGISISPKP